MMKAVMLGATLVACGWLSWHVTRRFLWFALEKDVLDVPNERSSHSSPIPRGAGIAFAGVFLVSILGLLAVSLITPREALGLITGGAIAVLGYYDDQLGLSIRFRLVVQLVAAGAAVFCLRGKLPLFTATSASSVPYGPTLLASLVIFAAVLAFTWVVNLTNFMDGIDGLAGTEAVTHSVVLAVLLMLNHHAEAEAMLYAVLAVSAFSFLLFNWPPARIFMGDAGSGFLGYCFAALALLSAGRGHLSLWTPTILLGVFIVDATTTLVRRVLAGQAWYRPHRTHAFQHASKRHGHRFTTLSVAAVNLLWLTPWAVLGETYSQKAPLVLLVAWLPLIGLAYALGAGVTTPPLEGWAATLYSRWRTDRFAATRTRALRLVAGGTGGLSWVRPRVSHAAPWMQLVTLFVLNVSCVYFAFLTLYDSMPGQPLRSALPWLACAWSAGECIVMWVFRVHKSYWRFTSTDDLPSVAGVALVASIVGAVIASFAAANLQVSVPHSIYVLDGMYSTLGFVGVRLLSRFVWLLVQRDTHRSRQRLVIYGADRAGTGILSNLRHHHSGSRMVGFLDDRPAMRGCTVCGLPVLGSSADLTRIAKIFHIDQVLLSSTMLPGNSTNTITEACVEAEVAFRTIVSISDVAGASRQTALRELSIDELLGRGEIEVNRASVGAYLAGSTCLVTGVGGVIGKELCCRIAQYHPASILGIDLHEAAIFEAANAVRTVNPHVVFVPLLGDIRNTQRMIEVMHTYRPEFVYHASAYQDESLRQEHLFELIEHNIFGTGALLTASRVSGVASFLLVSTIKAARPSSLAALTRRVAEQIVKSGCTSRLRSMCVRVPELLTFERGPLSEMRAQISRGGPVVVQENAMDAGLSVSATGELMLEAWRRWYSDDSLLGRVCIFVQSKPIELASVAGRMVRAAGLNPGRDIEIRITGAIEQSDQDAGLLDNIAPSGHPMMHVLEERWSGPMDLRHELDLLEEACSRRSVVDAISVLTRLVPGHAISTLVAQTTVEAAEDGLLTRASSGEIPMDGVLAGIAPSLQSA